MADSAPAIIFGTTAVAGWSANDINEAVLCLQKHRVTSLDTARVYVDLYYLHGPDPTTPIEDTLAGIREVYAAGKFRRFGISNYRPQDVRTIHSIQSAHASCLPTIYQGCYNAVARHAESDLFPVLRELGINFYAYSPIAGGFLAKRSSQLRPPKSDDGVVEKPHDGVVEGRFGAQNMGGDMYRTLYCKPTLLAALDEWNNIAADAGIDGSALAYRWVRFHSALGQGDGVIVGARHVGQLRGTLEVMAVAGGVNGGVGGTGRGKGGPLEKMVAERVGGIGGDAPRDNWDGFLRLRV
ncbi:MAG: hypothetical protein L6R37_006130 [Teloschistes peruensis]|nr:MAG: hypothetical protein L6R37_006130 [Teloschistes peruensis]